MPPGTTTACPACAAPVTSPDARFCQTCGNELTAPAPERRKVVTVLFADVTGSTALGEQLDPEVLRQVMGAFYDEARRVVLRHEGTVEKFVGDAVLAAFGVEVAREDDAMRAVRAATEMQQAVAQLAEGVRERYGLDLRVRIGVNTGEVVVGAARAGGSFATGDAVNTAARLEQAAAPGETWLGRATYLLVENDVDVEPLARMALRGKVEEQVAYRLVAVRAPSDGAARSAFVGRDRELTLLEGALSRTIETDTACLVTVVGDAGLGKSRLVAEFVATRPPDVRVLSGRCLSYGEGITFWPVMEVLRTACGLDGTEDPDTARERLTALAGDAPDAGAVVTQLAPLIGAGGEPGSVAEVTRAMQTVAEQLATSVPLVLSLDDLHWAEPALLDLVDALLRWCRDLPLMVLAQARPEFLDSRPEWGTAATNVTTLRLEPLGEAAAQELVRNIVGADVPAAQQLLAAGGGNPLFLEQLAVHATDGVAADSAVPPTLAALLAARLDQLGEDERRVVGCAAIIGQAFHVEEVLAIDTTLTATDVAAALEHLTNRQMVRRHREGGRGAYRFQHVLVQEAAYRSQPKSARAERHQQYAQWLAGHPQEAAVELDAIRGWHLEQAYRLLQELSPGDAAHAPLAAEAATSLADAARSREAADPGASIGLLKRAVALTFDPASRRQRLLRLAMVQFEHFAPPGDVLAVLADARAQEAESNAEAMLVDALEAAVRAQSEVDYDVRCLAAAATRALDATRDGSWRWAHAAAARIALLPLQTDTDWPRMYDVAEEWLAAATDAGEPAMREAALWWRTAILHWGPTPVRDALPYFEQTLAELSDQPVARERVLTDYAALLAMDGDDAGARAVLPPKPPPGSGEGNAGWAFGAAAVEEASGRVEEAALFARAGAEEMVAQGDVSYSSTLYGQAASWFAEAGRLDQARECLAIARDTSPAGDVTSQSLWRTAAALLAARDGDARQAVLLARECLEWGNPVTAPNEQAQQHRHAALALAAVGETAEAEARMAQARRLFEVKGNRAMIARSTLP